MLAITSTYLSNQFGWTQW